MHQPHNDNRLDHAKLNFETARIPWTGLQRVFAMGKVIYVSPELDLVDVAHQCAQDHHQQFQTWMNAGQLYAATDRQAQRWFENRAQVWAVVVKPWVLVQDIVDP